MAGNQKQTNRLKITQTGDAMVGKSSLIYRYTHNAFYNIFESECTIGVDFRVKIK